MKLSPYQIAAFTQVARDRSFSEAAVSLGVSQSSITQHVAKLEKIMGSPLFIRRREGVELTKAARELFEISDRLRTLEQVIEERIASYSDLSAGYLKIVANAPRPAMPILADYVRRFPKVEVEFSLFDWTTATTLLKNREADIGVITEPEPLDGTSIHELERTPYRAYMRADHPLAVRGELSLADLAEVPLIVPEDGSFTQKILLEKTGRRGIIMSQIIKTRTFPVMKEAILHGVGIGLMLENSMYPSQNLIALPVVELRDQYRHCLVTPREKGNLRIVQSFLDIARDRSAGLMKATER